MAILPAACSVGEWSTHTVGEWVGRTAGLEGIRDAVAASGIDGATLLCMDPSDASSASRLGLPSPFLLRHLCVHRDELLATLAQSAPATSRVDYMIVEALHSQLRGSHESLYELIRPWHRFHSPRRPRRAQLPTAGDYELSDAVDGVATLAPCDRPAIITGVC